MASPGRRLTPSERDRIVELRLNRVPVRTIAEQVGCQTKTVQATWQRWLRETAAERAEAIEVVREELIQRQEQIAIDARRGAIRARSEHDRGAETRFLAEERAALREMSRLQGMDAPMRVEHTGADGGPIEMTSPLDDLLAAVERLAPKSDDEG